MEGIKLQVDGYNAYRTVHAYTAIINGDKFKVKTYKDSKKSGKRRVESENLNIKSMVVKNLEDLKLTLLKIYAERYGPQIPQHMEEYIFTDAFLEEIGFVRVECSGSPQYGKAKSIKNSGITGLQWNNGGASCTYSGEPLNRNVYLGISKDWETRKAFNGYVFTKDDVKRLLNLTY